MYRAATRGLACLLLLSLLTGGCERRQHLVQQHLLEFGTLIEITLITPDLRQAQMLLDDIEQQLEQQRKSWHAWEDSDLTRFNAALARGETVRVPPSLSPLIELSREYYDKTDGLFNPALGKLIAARGFHGDAADEELAAVVLRDIPDMRDLVIQGGLARSSNPNLRLDFGGIAKGYAIGLVGRLLDNNGMQNYIVNAGGDMLISGTRFGRPWRIGIQNPFAPGAIAALELEGRHSLFTSGNYRRQYRRGSQLRHHIIDPRSGDSSQGQSAATVLLRDPTRADIAATVFMIDGARRPAELAAALAVNDFLIVSEARDILLSQRMAEKIQLKVNWPTKIVN